MNALWLSFRFLFFQIYIPNQNALLVSGFRRSRHLFLQFFLFIFTYMWIILNILPQNWAKLFKKSIFKMTITVFSIRNKLFPDCLGDELISVFFRIQALGQVSRCLVKVTQVVSQCLGVLEGALWFRGPPSVRLRLSGWSSRHRDRLWLPPPPPPRPRLPPPPHPVPIPRRTQLRGPVLSPKWPFFRRSRLSHLISPCVANWLPIDASASSGQPALVVEACLVWILVKFTWDVQYLISQNSNADSRKVLKIDDTWLNLRTSEYSINDIY